MLHNDYIARPYQAAKKLMLQKPDTICRSLKFIELKIFYHQNVSTNKDEKQDN